MASLYEQMNNLLTPDSFKEGLAKSAEENKDESMSDIFSFDRIKKEVLPQFREKDEIIEKAKATGTGLLTGTLGIPADLISLGSAATSFLAENTASPTSVLLKDAFEDTAKEWGRPAFDKWFTQTTGLKSNPENEDQLIGEILSPTGTILAPIKFILKGGKRILDLAEPFFKDPPSGGINSLELAGGVADTSAINKAPQLDDFNQPKIDLNVVGLNTEAGRAANNKYRVAEKEAMGGDYTPEKYTSLSQQAKDKLYFDTGMYRGSDKKLRFKIDTKDAQLNESFFKENNLFTMPNDSTLNQIDVGSIPEGTTLRDILNFEDLYKQYRNTSSNINSSLNVGDEFRVFQNLENIKIKSVDSIPEKYLSKNKRANVGAAYITGEDTIYIVKASPKQIRSTLLHEIQHAIQRREGFDTGGSAAAFLPENFQYVKDTFASNLKNDTTSLVKTLDEVLINKGSDFEINQTVLDSAANKLIEREYNFMTRGRGLTNTRIIDKNPTKGVYNIKKLDYTTDAGKTKEFSENEAFLINKLGNTKAFETHMLYRARIYREQLKLNAMQKKAYLNYMALPGEVEAYKIQSDDFITLKGENILGVSPSNQGLIQGQNIKPNQGINVEVNAMEKGN